MNKIIILFLCASILSCNTNINKSQKKQKTEYLKTKQIEEYVRSDISDIPDFIEFDYCQYDNSVFCRIYNNSDLASLYLKIPLSKIENFSILGQPGQCPTCIQSFVSSVNVLDNIVAVGMFFKGYNFYDCNGNFLFNILENGCPSGKCFFYGKYLISLPNASSDIKDYAVYIFNIQSHKLTKKLLHKKEFLEKTNPFYSNNSNNKNKTNLDYYSYYVTTYSYAFPDNKTLVILPSHHKGIHHFYTYNLQEQEIKKISLIRYCQKAYGKKPNFNFFQAIDNFCSNIVLVRPIFKDIDDNILFKKYRFLLMVFSIEGKLKKIIIPPASMFGKNYYGTTIPAINYLGENWFLINQKIFLLNNNKTKFKTYWRLIKFKGEELSEKEITTLVKKL